MPETYPGGVTREQYIAVLREAAKLACGHCAAYEPPIPRDDDTGMYVAYYIHLPSGRFCSVDRIHHRIAELAASASPA